MMKNIRLTALTLFIFCIAIPSFGQQTVSKIKSSGELKVGMTATQPPYSMIAKDSSIIGFEVDIAQIIADKMGVKLVSVKMNFADLLPALKNGEIDVIMSGMTMTTKRNMEVAFVGPYQIAGKTILTFAQIYADATGTEELNKGSVKIAALKGSTSESFVKLYMPKAKLSSTDNYDEAIKLLNNDKVGILVAETGIIRYTMLRYPESGFVSLENSFNYEPIGMAVLPTDYLLINLLDNLIDEMKEDGEMEEMESKWFWDDEWLELVD
jgi:polar amino acid transport system substrate-binding protein